MLSVVVYNTLYTQKANRNRGMTVLQIAFITLQFCKIANTIKGENHRVIIVVVIIASPRTLPLENAPTATTLVNGRRHKPYLLFTYSPTSSWCFL